LFRPGFTYSALIASQRDKAWSIYPYNCIGRWMFLRLRMSQHPLYSEVQRKVRDGASLLDIGCGLGQDLRKSVSGFKA
jgi:2-polyprenyl-3-methyl-5-hydroxy-6-metoxy-1,4-benzoquinol methylase